MIARLRRRSRIARTAPAFAVAGALSLLLPAPAFAHAVVYPKASSTGAYERYLLRVPNEKGVATTRIEIRFPAEARVTSFGDVAGWRLDVLTDSARRVVGAVWTGVLPPQRFVELPFIAVNPKSATRLVWAVTQTYGGETVEWTGAEGSKTPASITTISAAPAGDGGAPRWVPWTALAVALLGLGLALRRGPTAHDLRTGV